MIAFGDGLTDVGQTGTSYTVNDDTANNWTLQIAAQYGLKLEAASAGGLSYAQGNARIDTSPDAAGNATTPTVKQQIDNFLATHQFQDGDLVMIGAGISDLIVGMVRVNTGAQTDQEYLSAARQAGEAMAAQVHRLSNAGAKNILVVGSYDLSRTPWAKALGQQNLISEASRHFNNGLLVKINDLTRTAAFVDPAYYVNLFEGSSGGYGFSERETPLCTSVDAGPGIGIGTGEVNSAHCTPDTLVADAQTANYLFADKIYLTPAAHRLLGNYAYDRLRVRW